MSSLAIRRSQRPSIGPPFLEGTGLMKPESQRLGRHEERRPLSFIANPGRYARRGHCGTSGAGGVQGTGLSQIFSASKGVDSRALNRAGVQPFRAVSRATDLRIAAAGRAGKLDDLSRRGIVILKTPPSRRSSRNCDTRLQSSPNSARRRRSTRTARHGAYRWNLPPDESNQFPRLTEWTDQPRVIRPRAQRSSGRCGRARACECWSTCTSATPACMTGRPICISTRSSTPTSCGSTSTTSRQTHAPFVYVPMSHKLDWIRLRGDYLESIGKNLLSAADR